MSCNLQRLRTGPRLALAFGAVVREQASRLAAAVDRFRLRAA
jgi:hypothetical protein